jgi:hypothetical protein
MDDQELQHKRSSVMYPLAYLTDRCRVLATLLLVFQDIIQNGDADEQ